MTLHVIIIIILFIPTWKIEPTSSTSSRPSARDTSISLSTLTSSSLAPPHANGGQENNLTGIISGVIVVVIVIVLLIIILITSVLILRRKKKGSMKLLNINSTGQSNPVYQSDTLVKGKPGLDIPLTNPVYGGNINIILLFLLYYCITVFVIFEVISFFCVSSLISSCK